MLQALADLIDSGVFRQTPGFEEAEFGRGHSTIASALLHSRPLSLALSKG